MDIFPMTRAQRRQIQAYMHFRDKPMSVLGLVRFNWRIFAILIVLGAASVGFMLYFHNTFLAWLFGVAYGAALLRDLGQFNKWSRTWPVIREVLDWTKIEALVSENGLAA